jgi:choline-sulfatase
MTGRYPRSIGVTLSRTPLPGRETTLPAMLRDSGYETAAFGKTHYYHPRRHEFDVCLDFPEYMDWLRDRGGEPIVDGQTLGTWRPFRDLATVWLNSGILPYRARDAEMLGSFLASQAASYLSGARARPFFLYVSFYETHSPFWFPVEYRGRHHAHAFRAPAVTTEDAQKLPAVFTDLTNAEKQGIMAAYSTSTEFLDKNVGIVLDSLDRSPYANNTLVIFSSDHGYLLGQHGRFEKHCCFEPAIRVALLMRYPGWIRPGRSSAALVQLIDIAPTLLELCGMPMKQPMHGLSLGKVLREETVKHRDCIFVEYADNEEAMVRTDRWKLIYSSGKRLRRDGYAVGQPTGVPFVQLFDLENDPDELRNLADQPEHAERVAKLTRELSDHLLATSRDSVEITDPSDSASILRQCLGPRDVVM